MNKRLLFTVICVLASAGAWADDDPIILPWGTIEPWQMKFVKDPPGGYDDPQPGVDANGLSWTQPGYDDSQWETMTGPMANGTLDAPNGPRPILDPNYTWEDDGIGHSFCLRRTFSLDTVNPGGYTLAIIYDDYVTVYINGQKVLDAAGLIDASLFHEGENLLTICFYAAAGWYNFLDYALFSGQNYTETSSSLGPINFGGFYYYLNMKDHTAKVNSLETFNSVSIIIPDTICGDYAVTSIGANAFRDSEIETITFPSTIKSIGSDAFGNCTSLDKVYISDLEAWCDIAFSNGDSNPMKTAGKLYLNGSRITALTIPESVTEIKNYAFISGKFTSLTLPNTITKIGASAFSNCNTLRTATINNVAETGCQLATIGSNAFHGCGVLQSINFTHYPTSIGDGAFWGCSSLTSIELNNNLTFIQPNTFYECRNLTTINIPSHLESIGDEAFYGCGNLLIDLDFPEGLTSIGNYAFSGCTDINKVNFPNSLAHIGDYAFSAWGGTCGFHSIYIPASVTFIGSLAFAGLNKAKSVIVAEDNPNYDSRGNCNAIIETRTGKLLAGCRNTFIPEGVTYIDHWAMSCLPNTTFILPNTVEELKENSFSSNGNMTTLVLGSGVTDIDRYIYFASAPSVIYCYATEVPMADGNAFESAYQNLYVPAQSIEDYRNTVPWDRFQNIKPITGDERFTVDIYLTASFDNSSLLNHYNGYDANVTLERTFHKDGKWNTLCLPFSVTAKEMEAWEHPLREATIVRLEPSASSLKADGTLDILFVKTDNIEAGKPYLVKWEEGDDLVEPVFKNVLLTCTEPTSIEFANEKGSDACKFVGQFSPFYVTEDNINKIVQFSADNQPCYSSEPDTLYSSLAHFEIDGMVTDSNIKFRGIEGTGVDVEIGPTGYATLYDIYGDLCIPSGVTAYTAVLKDKYVELTMIGENMPVKTPVVLQGAEGIYNFSYTTNAEPVGENDLIGTAEPMVTTGTQYVLSDVEDIAVFLKAKTGSIILAGTAYLDVDAPGTKMFFFNEDDATGIMNLNGLKDFNDVIYNLVGQRLSKPQKGINIKGGKKVIFY